MGTVINSSNLLVEMEKLKGLTVKPPAIPAAVALPDQLEAQIAELSPTMDVAAIAEAVTEKVIATLSAAPELESSELEPLPVTEVDEDVDLVEQEKALNEIDEADHAEVVSLKIPASIPAPKMPLQLPQAVLLSPEDVLVLRAALRANLMHVVIKVLSLALQEK
jgi:hypothetical protein